MIDAFPPTDVKRYFSHTSGRTQWMAILPNYMDYDSWIGIVSVFVCLLSNDFSVNLTFSFDVSSTVLALYS